MRCCLTVAMPIATTTTEIATTTVGIATIDDWIGKGPGAGRLHPGRPALGQDADGEVHQSATDAGILRLRSAGRCSPWRRRAGMHLAPDGRTMAAAFPPTQTVGVFVYP